MRHSTKAVGLAAITLAALATSACGGTTKAANNAASAIAPINTVTTGNDASAMESIGTPSTNNMAPLPPVSSTRNTAAPAGNGSAGHSDAPSSGPTRVESNVSGM